MTQVASYQVPAHPSGIEMRTQLNAIILALIGDNAGPTEPVEKYPGMMWGDTTAAKLKRRNNANDAWIVIGPLDDFLGDLRSQTAQVNNKVSKTGDHMTGDLYLDNAALHLHVPNVIQAWLRADAGMPGCGFINSGNSAWNLMLYDDGRYTFRGYNTGVFECIQNGDYNGYRGYLGPGYIKLTRYDWGPYIDFARTTDQDYTWRMNYENSNDRFVVVRKGGGNFQIDGAGSIFASNQVCAGGGSAILATDGNINGSVWGGWLSNWMGNKVGRAECQHNSGLSEFGNIVQGDSGHGECTCPNPWVMVGLRGARWETWIRGIVLRNAP